GIAARSRHPAERDLSRRREIVFGPGGERARDEQHPPQERKDVLRELHRGKNRGGDRAGCPARSASLTRRPTVWCSKRRRGCPFPSPSIAQPRAAPASAAAERSPPS